MLLATGTSTGITVGDLSATLAIFTFVLAVIGGIVTYFLRRRGSSGTTDTSDADVLWRQAQAMRAELQSQLDKAIEQRDQLFELQSAQVLPVLSAINASLQVITDSLTRLEGKRNASAK